MVEHFEEKLNEYAHLLVEVGMNLQPGQLPRIASPVECAPLARLCVQAALDAGARDVLVEWTDDFVTRQRYLKAGDEAFIVFPDYMKGKFDWMLEQECTALSIIGSDPEVLLGVDPARIQAWQRASSEPTKPWHDTMTVSYTHLPRLVHDLKALLALPQRERPAGVVAAGDGLGHPAQRLVEEIHVGQIVQIDGGPQPIGQQEFLCRGLVGGKHNLAAGKAAALGHHQLRQ